jgi:hypothetical protein
MSWATDRRAQKQRPPFFFRAARCMEANRMDADNLERRDAATAMIVAVIQNAEELACMTADYLNELTPDARAHRKKWSPELLLELGGAMKLRSWERAGIKDQIDSSLPESHDVLVSLDQRLLANDFNAGDTSLAERVQICWWERIAHPKSRCLRQDFVLSPISGQDLLTLVGRCAWNLRHLAIPETE